EEYLEVIIDDKKYQKNIEVLFEHPRDADEANVNDFSLTGHPYFLVKPGEVKILLIG
ncbi:MAG: hypothetical protein GX232_04360, partial [Acholeplasmataceae bacterium]|nr:hypothetical protein [Acholeplasmataceae bacterium]